MQAHEPPLFTPTEAAVLTQLSLKAVNNAIDRKTVPTTSGRRAGEATRLLDLRGLMSLALERRLADRMVPGLRRELFDALADAQHSFVSLEGALVREWTAIRAFILAPPVTSSERRLAYPNLSFD